MKTFIKCLPLLFLMSCAESPKFNYPVTLAAASQEIYRVEGLYAAARVIENAYYDLPRCGMLAAANTKNPLLCSDVNILRKVRKADNLAYAAIMHAEDIVNAAGASPSDSELAIAKAKPLVDTFSSLTKTLKVK